ncbi:MAG: outer membrane beta-barrel protein [Robiginitomaculum sp.]
MTHFKLSLASGLVALALMAAPAYGQDAPEGDQQIYEPAYFESYAPRTAMDMVSRIPGYRLNRSDNKRGLGNGGANILINGARVAGKSSAREQLSATPAKNVVRIEILDGASLGIPGLSGQVANIITKAAGLSGTWQWRPEFRPRLSPNYFPMSVSVSGEKKDLTYSLSLNSRPRRQGHAGPETHTGADGILYEIRDEDAQYNNDNIGGSVNVTWKPKTGHVANLNLNYNNANFHLREFSKRQALTARGSNDETLFTAGEDEWNADGSADYEFPLDVMGLGGKLKLTGYHRFEHSPTASQFDIYTPNIGHVYGSRFLRLGDEAETIGRAEYSWSKTKGRDWQFGIENTFNFLDNASRFLEWDGVDYIEQALDDPKVRVEENRMEATLTHSRQLSPKWDVQMSLGAEYSEISSKSESVSQERDFIRPKGFVSATYKPSDTLTVHSKLEREVGQLDFFDFISSVSLEDDFDTTGNINIVPQQAWAGEIEFDKNLGQDSTLKLKLFGSLITDLVDRIPLAGGGDAVGNIDSASQYGAQLSTTINGGRWGYEGMELELEYEWQNSNVDDPLLGFSRRLNGDWISSWDANFRHDIPKTDWAYGTFIEERENAQSYRLQTISWHNQIGAFMGIYAEHKDVFGMKVSLMAMNLLDVSDDRERQVFTDRRDIGVLDHTEYQSRDFGILWRLRVSGTF